LTYHENLPLNIPLFFGGSSHFTVNEETLKRLWPNMVRSGMLSLGQQPHQPLTYQEICEIKRRPKNKGNVVGIEAQRFRRAREAEMKRMAEAAEVKQSQQQGPLADFAHSRRSVT
jgi:hypothetical protein